MFKFAFIDLDATLFNTRQFVEDKKKIFYDQGVKENDFVHSYLLAIHGNKTGPVGYYDYTFKNHLKALEGLGYKFKPEVEKELNSLFKNLYIFPDTYEFLEDIRKKTEKLVLLSAGNKAFQVRKLRSIKLDKSFDDIIIPHYHKDQILMERFKEKTKVLFVNDSLRENKAVKQALPWVQVVSKVNPRTKIEEYQESGIPFFKTLSEISKYVAKIV